MTQDTKWVRVRFRVRVSVSVSISVGRGGGDGEWGGRRRGGGLMTQDIERFHWLLLRIHLAGHEARRLKD